MWLIHFLDVMSPEVLLINGFVFCWRWIFDGLASSFVNRVNCSFQWRRSVSWKWFSSQLCLNWSVNLFKSIYTCSIVCLIDVCWLNVVPVIHFLYQWMWGCEWVRVKSDSVLLPTLTLIHHDKLLFLLKVILCFIKEDFIYLLLRNISNKKREEWIGEVLVAWTTFGWLFVFLHHLEWRTIMQSEIFFFYKGKKAFHRHVRETKVKFCVVSREYNGKPCKCCIAFEQRRDLMLIWRPQWNKCRKLFYLVFQTTF